MMSHIVATVLSALFAIPLSQLLQIGMQRAPIRQRYKSTALHCMNCGVAFAGVQRVPVLAGNCRNCGKGISADSPWFEAVVVVALGAVGAIVGLSLALPAYLVFVGSLIALTVVDLRHFLLPNRIVYPTLFACMALMLLPAIAGDWSQYGTALIGMAVSWIFFFVVFFINPRGLGFGDVRLSALNGFMTGWLAVSNAILAILLGLFTGAAVGLLLMITRIRGPKEHIPYGPFLALGAVLAIFGPILLAK